MGQNSPEEFVDNGAKSCTAGEFIVIVVCFDLGLKKLLFVCLIDLIL